MSARIDLFYFEAGGGHRAAATALESVIADQKRPWKVRLVNLQDLFDSVDPLRRLTGLRVQNFYNYLIRKGWTLSSAQLLKLLQTLIRLFRPLELRLLKRFWREDAPDMVISVIPNFNRVLCQAFREVKPGAPFVTILTDLADYPPHFWIEKQEQYVICGSKRAVNQAREIGIPPDHILKTSGMILRPSFYAPLVSDREQERVRLGLEPDLPTGLVLFGGHGSKAMLEIARRVGAVRRPLQMIFLCGHNERLAARLRARNCSYPSVIKGFTTEVPYYMRLADFFIGKPGPGSLSEAVAMGLPVIVERNAWTLPQERYNTEWIIENNVGLVVNSFREVATAVEELLEPNKFERCHVSAVGLENRAVYEIMRMLASIFEKTVRDSG